MAKTKTKAKKNIVDVRTQVLKYLDGTFQQKFYRLDLDVEAKDLTVFIPETEAGHYFNLAFVEGVLNPLVKYFNLYKQPINYFFNGNKCLIWFQKEV